MLNLNGALRKKYIVGDTIYLTSVFSKSLVDQYRETSTTYQFKGAIICKRKGIYGFSVSDLLSPGLRGKNCTKAGFAMTVINSDKHLHLHQYVLGVDPNDVMLKRIGYDFRVHRQRAYNKSEFVTLTDECEKPDVRKMPIFRNRLLQQNGNNQIVNVNDLCFSYGY